MLATHNTVRSPDADRGRLVIFFEESWIDVDVLRRHGMLWLPERPPYALSPHGVNPPGQNPSSRFTGDMVNRRAFLPETSLCATDKASRKAQTYRAAGGWADCPFAPLQFWNPLP
jgi:hypothetical protein